jgi:hypothetical protein
MVNRTVVVSRAVVVSGLAPRWAAKQPPNREPPPINRQNATADFRAASRPSAGQARSPQQARSLQQPRSPQQARSPQTTAVLFGFPNDTIRNIRLSEHLPCFAADDRRNPHKFHTVVVIFVTCQLAYILLHQVF